VPQVDQKGKHPRLSQQSGFKLEEEKPPTDGVYRSAATGATTLPPAGHAHPGH